MKICPKSMETNLQNAKGNLYKMVKPSAQPEEKIRWKRANFPKKYLEKKRGFYKMRLPELP